MKNFSKFLRGDKGNIAVIAAIALVPIMGVVGVTVDYSSMGQMKSRLQETADSTALYIVKELEKPGTTESDLARVAADVVASNFDIETDDLDIDLNTENKTVLVNLESDFEPFILNETIVGDLSVHVTAEVKYDFELSDPVCMLSLSKNATKAVSLTGNGDLNLENCSLHVNSTAYNAVNLTGNSTIDANSTCVVGDVGRGDRRISPAASTNCAPMSDPFADMIISSTVSCSGERAAKYKKDTTLSPGVFCGGWDISSNADVELEEGIYVIKDGGLKMSGNATLAGQNVTLVFTGNNVGINMSGNASFNMTASTSGDFEGFLFFFDPDSVDSWDTIKLTGNSDTYFEGILYFGDQEVKISGNGELNNGSPYSVFVADRLTMNGNATVNFNIDTDNMDYNVPDELYNKEITAYLSK